MNIPAHAPLHLLHRAATGTLATHARQPAGFPYPTLLPFAPDARHRPTILVSRLAEHTRNLQDDRRAGFLVTHVLGGDVLDSERETLLGRFEPVDEDAVPALTRRYVRYHPEAQRYLELGDFTFWTMQIERLRYIGGFGAMGWLGGAELDPLEPLPADEEEALIRFFDTHPDRADTLFLAGVDCYGADLKVDGVRTRVVFAEPQVDPASLRSLLDDCIEPYRA